MKYDFTKIMDRRGKDSIAADIIPVLNATVDEGFSKIPMWVADMNFETAPSITKAIIERAQHPVFGYTDFPDEYFEAIINWHKERNGIDDLKKEYISYENGVLGGVISAVNAFSSPGDSILLHSPTYIGFTNSIKNSGRNIVLSELVIDENNIVRMDFDDMDKKLKENNIHLVIFCSPHNPCGRVWEKWEIEKAMEIYKKNDCIVIADEIWSDIITPGYTHIPAWSVSEDAKHRVIAFSAPSKTFNLAGLVGSYHIIYDKYLRDRVERASTLSHYNNVNVLSMRALIGAYSKEGGEWVDELNQVIAQNIDYAFDYINTHFEGVKTVKPQGTYMMYLDLHDYIKKSGLDLDEILREGIKCGVIWQDGRPFNKDETIRINLALPMSMLKEALDRLDKYVFNK